MIRVLSRASQRRTSSTGSYIQLSDDLVADGREVVDDVRARLDFEFTLGSRLLGQQLELVDKLSGSRVKVLSEVVQDLGLVVIGALPPS